MVIQRASQPEYVHFNLKQTGTTLTGSYLDKAGKSYPLSGTVDGQHFRMIVTLPNGTSALMEGRLDGTSDMVGKLTTPTEEAYFTASWRPKEKWIENINASPGGLGGTGRRRRRRLPRRSAVAGVRSLLRRSGFLEPLFYIRHQAAGVDQRAHERRKLGGAISLPFVMFRTSAAGRIDFDLVAALDTVNGFHRFEDR